jgi:type IV conjugative transfer system protein TraE
MIVKKYLSRISNLWQENRLLRMCLGFLSIAVVISSIASYKALNFTRTIVTPAGMSESFEVSSNKMSASGIKMFTRYAFDLFLNYTPNSAKIKFDELLKMVNTRYYDEVNDELRRNLENIDRLHIVSVYQIEEIKINNVENKIRVKGIRTRSTYGKQIDETIEEWELAFEIVDSNFKIVKIQKSA